MPVSRVVTRGVPDGCRVRPAFSMRLRCGWAWCVVSTALGLNQSTAYWQGRARVERRDRVSHRVGVRIEVRNGKGGEVAQGYGQVGLKLGVAVGVGVCVGVGGRG